MMYNSKSKDIICLCIYNLDGGKDSNQLVNILADIYNKYFKDYLKIVFELIRDNSSAHFNINYIDIKYVEKLFSQSGIFRFIRISPFSSKRQTSLIVVNVFYKKEIQFNLDPKDLRIDRFRAGGPGGQFVNKTESAVRVVHLPTKLSVVCQDYRNQLQNKQKALDILQQKIIKLKEMEAPKYKINNNVIFTIVFDPVEYIRNEVTKKKSMNLKNLLKGNADFLFNSF